MIGCTITGNTAGDQGGGGVYNGLGMLTIARSKIYGNTSNGAANDILKDYWGRLSLANDYAALVELYKPDGLIPNR